MIIARNIGRLGNNMFQISAALGYARKYGYEWAADFGNGLGEPYSSIHQVFPNLPKSGYGAKLRYHEHLDEFCTLHNTHKNECHFDYHPIPNLGPNLTLTGFYQSYKYFEGHDAEIKKIFELPHWVEYEDYISIHVRRGDYVQHSGSFPPITKDYIDKALSILNSQNINIKTLLIFSDELQWAKDNLTDYNCLFIEPGDIKNLSKMASCKHHIISNSTFSWWASYLGHNPNKIVISPSADTWFGPMAGVKKPVRDLIPHNWIQISTR